MTTSSFPISRSEKVNDSDSSRDHRRVPVPRQLHAVVERAQAGDEDAFSELYEKNNRNVFGICMRMVRNYALAEDLTQEAFLQLHRKISSFRGESAFTTWLHRLAVNTVLMHLRKRALAVVSLDHLMEDIPEERAARGFGTRDLMQAGVGDRLDIKRAVENMAPGYRRIFLLHDVHGFDHGEIASMLKCSRGNTKSQLHKARRILRGALTQSETVVSKASTLFMVADPVGTTKNRSNFGRTAVSVAPA